MDHFHETQPKTELKSAVMGKESSKKNRPLERDFQPTFQEVDLMDLRNMKDCVELAREYAHEVLTNHDTRLGRTTRSNKITAEGIENDLRMITATLEKVNQIIQ